MADFFRSGVGLEEAIDEAVKAFAAAGQVKVDESERIDRQFGGEPKARRLEPISYGAHGLESDLKWDIMTQTTAFRRGMDAC